MQEAEEATRPGSAEPLPRGFEFAVEAAAAAEATAAQLEMLDAHRSAWRWTLERLLDETDEDLESVRSINAPERDQVVADFEEERDRLEAALARLTSADDHSAMPLLLESAGEVRLQASWAAGRLVVWAAGPGTEPATAEELADRLENAGVRSSGWTSHPPVKLPSGTGAPALSIPVGESLGWLVAVGGGHDDDGVGASVTWLGRVAVWAVRLVASGSIVPTLRTRRRGRQQQESEKATTELSVRWAPALVGSSELDELAAAMPGPVTALERTDARPLTLAVLGAVVDAIATDAASRSSCPPRRRSPGPGRRRRGLPHPARRLRVRGPARRRRRGLQAPRPLGQPGHRTDRRPARRAARPARRRRRLVPVGARPGRRRQPPPDRGRARRQPPEAAPGRRAGPPRAPPARAAPPRRPAPRPGRPEPGRGVGADDRHRPARSRPPASTCGCPRCRGASRPRRCGCSPSRSGESVVGAHQLRNVRWSAVFDDVELTAAEIARLAAEARPLVRSHGKWVELDRVDLKEAAAALAERAEHHAADRRRDPAPRRRPRGLAARRRRHASRAAAGPPTCSPRPSSVSTEPVTTPEGFDGELRSYQAEALAWLGFLDAVELGGCLALDMGLGKTPDGARPPRPHRGQRPGARHRPARRRRQLGGRGGPVHARASRSSSTTAPRRAVGRRAGERGRRRRRRHHHLRHRRARHRGARRASTWDRVVLDEAQAIKNPANETAQQLRRIPARARIALTGTPIENGLGDLWAILDFTNPGLVGSRAGVHRPAVRRRRRPRQGRSRAARPQRHPRVPPHQERADRRRRAARPHRRARPLHDDARADRPLPGRARRPRAERRRRRRRASPARARSSPPSPRSSRSATTRPPTRPTTARSPAAPASWPASRRSSTRCSPPASGS